MRHTNASRIDRWAVLLLAAALVLGTPALAQGQVSLRSVEPDRGEPGQQLTLILRGSGFGGANVVHVNIGGLEVRDVEVVSDEEIHARVTIPEGAEPGPRDVEVAADFGPQEIFTDVLQGGFTVLERRELPAGPGAGPVDEGGQAPGPVDEGEEGGYDENNGGVDWPIWAAMIGGGALLLTAAAIIVTLVVHRSLQKKRWQKEAHEIPEEDMPESCQQRKLFVRRERPEISPGRWKVTKLAATLYDAAAGRRGQTHQVSPELVKRIDKAARDRLLWGNSERLTQEAAEIAREAAVLVTMWQTSSEQGRDVYLEPQIEGGEASVSFILYRCVGEPGRWKQVLQWKAKVQAARPMAQTFNGPAAGQTAEVYRAQLEERLGSALYDLIQEIGRLV